MKYYSTNRRTPEVSLREAVVASMAPDNGLYMPERIERLPDAFFDGIARLDLHRIACRVADAFFGEEIEPETLRRIVRDTFCFDIPVVRVDDGIWALELFHGPTMAFKDVGARFMARILSHFIEGRDDEHPVTVLVATSGDTGGAVANGFLGVEGIDVVVLYPKGRVSDIQEKQFTTLGRILDRTVRPNGMEIRKVSVPFGVVGVIYEARPNVGFDVFALCVKSGNACILKGGSDARDSNAAIAALIRRTLAAHGFDENTLALLPPTHEATAALLGATGLVDLVIPRGGRGLIDFVRDHARVPVIETGAGVCHAYFDRSGDTEKGAAIVLNAKTRRVSVCNALDTLVVHRDRLTDLPRLCRPLAEKGVELQADEAARTALHGNYPAALLRAADTASFGTEFLSLRLSIRTVVSLDEALAHIARYSSQHSETIIAEDAEAIRTFQREVDAACVYANVSTAFTDGAQFGMGAEIGISTQKLHARGPMALRELTSYKYLIAGDGQTRP